MATQIYPTPSVNDTSGVFELFGYVNTVSDGLMFPVILGVLWIIVFISTKRFSSSRAWTFASFFVMVISIILAVLDLVAPRYMYLAIFAVAIGAVWMKLEATST